MKSLVVLLVIAVIIAILFLGNTNTVMFAFTSPASPVSPTPSPTVSWISPPTRVPSDDPEYNECVDEMLRDYRQAGLKWAEAYCRGDTDTHPSKYWPTPTPFVPYLPTQVAKCWYQCKVIEGHTGGEVLINCYKGCMEEAPPIPDPFTSPTLLHRHLSRRDPCRT